MSTEKIRKSVFIAASPAKVFGWLADPTHLPEVWPSVVEVKNVEMTPEGGHTYDWTYQMAGMKFHGRSETFEVERDRFRAWRTTGGIPSTIRHRFEPHDDGTDFSIEVEYEIPGQLLGRLAAPFVRRLNEREAETFVQNTKERMEMD